MVEIENFHKLSSDLYMCVVTCVLPYPTTIISKYVTLTREARPKGGKSRHWPGEKWDPHPLLGEDKMEKHLAAPYKVKQ